MYTQHKQYSTHALCQTPESHSDQVQLEKQRCEKEVELSEEGVAKPDADVLFAPAGQLRSQGLSRYICSQPQPPTLSSLDQLCMLNNQTICLSGIKRDLGNKNNLSLCGQLAEKERFANWERNRREESMMRQSDVKYFPFLIKLVLSKDSLLQLKNNNNIMLKTIAKCV